MIKGPFQILPMAVDHFEGAVIYIVEFGLTHQHKILIAWDMTSLPLEASQIDALKKPSLAMVEATTWQPLDVGHTSIVELVENQFLERLHLAYLPQKTTIWLLFCTL